MAALRHEEEMNRSLIETQNEEVCSSQRTECRSFITDSLSLNPFDFFVFLCFLYSMKKHLSLIGHAKKKRYSHFLCENGMFVALTYFLLWILIGANCKRDRRAGKNRKREKRARRTRTESDGDEGNRKKSKWKCLFWSVFMTFCWQRELEEQKKQKMEQLPPEPRDGFSSLCVSLSFSFRDLILVFVILSRNS